jgi:hypothetical protein
MSKTLTQIAQGINKIKEVDPEVVKIVWNEYCSGLGQSLPMPIIRTYVLRHKDFLKLHIRLIKLDPLTYEKTKNAEYSEDDKSKLEGLAGFTLIGEQDYTIFLDKTFLDRDKGNSNASQVLMHEIGHIYDIVNSSLTGTQSKIQPQLEIYDRRDHPHKGVA